MSNVGDAIKKVQNDVAKTIEKVDQVELAFKDLRFRTSCQIQGLTDDLQTIDVLIQHALQDAHQVKNLDGSIDRSCFNATVKLLEAVESIVKDYR